MKNGRAAKFTALGYAVVRWSKSDNKWVIADNGEYELCDISKPQAEQECRQLNIQHKGQRLYFRVIKIRITEVNMKP